LLRDPTDDLVDHAIKRKTIDLDDDVRGLAGEQLALGAQLAQERLGDADLEQRPTAITPQPSPQKIVAGIEEDAHGPGMQQLAVRGPQDGATAGRDDRRPGIDKRGKGLGFPLAEGRLAMMLEQLGDRAAVLALDLSIAIRERHAEPACRFLA